MSLRHRSSGGIALAVAIAFATPASAQRALAGYLSDHYRETFRAQLDPDATWRQGRLMDLSDSDMVLMFRRDGWRIPFRDLKALDLSRDREQAPAINGMILGSSLLGATGAALIAGAHARATGGGGVAVVTVSFLGGGVCGTILGATGAWLWRSHQPRWRAVPLDSLR